MNTSKSFLVKSLCISVIMAILVFYLTISYYNDSLEPVADKDNIKSIEINIPMGSNIRQIALLLKEKNLIKNDFTFRVYCKIAKKDAKLKSGVYILNTSQDVKDIIEVLENGKISEETIRFTIPEGYELRQIADKLQSLGIIDKEVFFEKVNSGVFHYDFLDDIKIHDNRLEGYLFPDTYEIKKGAKEEEIINKMLYRFDSIFNDEYKKRAKELGMSIHEVITLASIIEREARLDSERKTVASVFHNRLKKNMNLQSCATVQYILKERKEVLLYKDLEIESPYNTYKYNGLPLGPIASPGKKSIEAALYPDESDYLYFVANKNGAHVFSTSYSEHLKAQNRIKNQ